MDTEETIQEASGCPRPEGVNNGPTPR